MTSPLSNFRAPVVRGGVGRDVSIPWTSRDDALLLLGVYKHGYRAFEEIRDDAELAFSCQRQGMPPLPAPLAPPDQPPAPNGGGIMGHPVADACFEPQDRLPLPAAWAAGPRRRAVAPPPLPKGEHAPCFLNERDFRERVKALIDVLGEQACMYVYVCGVSVYLCTTCACTCTCDMCVCMCVCMCMSRLRTHTCVLAEQERDREELGVWKIEWEEEMQSGAASSGR